MMQLDLVGWPLGAVLAGVVAVPLAWHCYRRQVGGLRPSAAWGLPLVRALVLVLVALLLAEPAVLHRSSRRHEAVIEVLIDTGATMAASDPTMAPGLLLDEVIAAGVAEFPQRDQGPRRVLDLLDEMTQVLEAGHQDADEARSLRALQSQLQRAAETVSGHEDLVAGLADLDQQLTELKDAPQASRSSLRRQMATVRRAAHIAQDAADAALINALDDDDPRRAAVHDYAALPRIERLAMIWRRQLAGRLGSARLRLRRADGNRAVLDSGELGADLALDLQADYTQALRRLAEMPGDEHLAGVLVIGDGRQRSEADPGAVARALGLRSIPVCGLWLGSPDLPRDAAIAGIDGTREVYHGETVSLDVRYRITGYGDLPWSLILRRDGEEIERRPVVGGDDWREERFEFVADSAGLIGVEARLESGADVSEEFRRHHADQRGGLLWEAWTGISVSSAQTLHELAVFDEEPMEQRTVSSAASPDNWADDYVSRLSGWVVPPVTGDYRFFVRADDGAQLWLSDGHDRESLRLIASCPSHVGTDTWDRFDEQRSDLITLRAGRPYRIEALHYEQRGNDHVAIAWQMPDGSIERPIGGDHLLPHSDDVRALLASDQWQTDDGEAAYAPQALRDNDSARSVVVVHEDSLRILLLDQVPRCDARYLVSQLERDRRVIVDRRYRQIRLAQGDTELMPTSQEELDDYDVVILGDLRPDEIDTEAQMRLLRFVQNRGGLLIALAGPRGLPHRFGLGPLAELMPVVNQGDVPAARRGGHRLQLAVSDQEEPWIQILDDPELNRRLWPLLPPLTWVAEGMVAKSGARVLLETDGADPVPVVVTARSGAGRVLYVGSDETWRWRDRLGGRVHESFWLQGLRWGLGGRLRGADPRLQVALGRTMIEPGQDFEIRTRARLDDGSPAQGPVQVAIRSAEEGSDPDAPALRVLDMEPVADADGIWRVAIEGLPAGRWQMQVRAEDPGLDGLLEERTILVASRGERATAELRSDPDIFRRLAESSQGRSAHIGMADAVLDHLRLVAQPRDDEQVRTYRLWDHYHVIILITALLFGEWLWRKREGLP